MRCFFIIDGHIQAVEELTGLSDQEAIARSKALFAERRELYDTFEIWEGTRIVYRDLPTHGPSKHNEQRPAAGEDVGG